MKKDRTIDVPLDADLSEEEFTEEWSNFDGKLYVRDETAERIRKTLRLKEI
jgi:hypothetical protein